MPEPMELDKATSDVVVLDETPEGLVDDLDLSKHTKGYWPSSKNVTQ